MAYKNASVNIYMYHGGTNFGFWNGANGDFTSYQPTITSYVALLSLLGCFFVVFVIFLYSCSCSYDYNAPLNEAGDPTDKYVVIRQVIAQFEPVPSGPLPVPSAKGDYGTITLDEQVLQTSPHPTSNPPPFIFCVALILELGLTLRVRSARVSFHCSYHNLLHLHF